MTISIDVYGNNSEDTNVICNVINNTLHKEGFNDVTFINEDETDGKVIDDTKSMLDLIRHERPHLFSTPIIICEIQNDEKDENSNIDNDIPDEAAIAYIENQEHAVIID